MEKESYIRAQKLTSHIISRSKKSPAIKKMYYFNKNIDFMPVDINRDLLIENKTTPVKGLVHKFPGRVLFLLSYSCFANCRFCERQDRVGVGLDNCGMLNEKEIKSAINYIRKNKTIKEVIFSGGDPLTNPKGLSLAVKLLSKIPHVKILRIHSKAPIVAPDSINLRLLKELKSFNGTFYFIVHINHPDELDKKTVKILSEIRNLGYIMLNQNIFLKGVNDSYMTLKTLFEKLIEIGIKPYYIYHCQDIPPTKPFVMNIKDEIKIMTKLRENISGIAFPSHVLDMEGTTGKIIFPTNHWKFDLTKVKDFTNKYFSLKKWIK